MTVPVVDSPDGLKNSLPKSGDSPHFIETNRVRPIRKRGWYRALRAGKLWAIVSYKYRDAVCLLINGEFRTFAKIMPDRNLREDECYITWPMEWVYQTIKLELE